MKGVGTAAPFEDVVATQATQHVVAIVTDEEITVP
jgi:hypothetical protein